MPYHNFRLQVLLRLLLVFGALTALAFYLMIQPNEIRATALGVLIGILAVELFRYIDRSNRALATFLENLSHNDFVAAIPRDKRGASFQRLSSAFDEVAASFRGLSQAREEQYLYLQYLVAHLQVGILSLDEAGNVELMNQAMKDLLHRPHLHHLSGLEAQNREVYQILKHIQPTEQRLCTVEHEGEQSQLTLRATFFKLGDTDYKLITAQDIKGELATKEMNAWQQLIRVLAHEIMNSVTPISSLSQSLQALSADNALPSTKETLAKGLAAIHSRSQGLIHFTEAYHQLAHLPQPKYETITATTWTRRLKTLLAPIFSESTAQLTFHIQPPSFTFRADPYLLEQALINLIKNAREATAAQTDGLVSCTISSTQNGKTQIVIQDNGTGIPPALHDRIFVPFYTTKPNGSGIGLSLARQIVLQHQGSLTLLRSSEEGTAFQVVI